MKGPKLSLGSNAGALRRLEIPTRARHRQRTTRVESSLNIKIGAPSNSWSGVVWTVSLYRRGWLIRRQYRRIGPHPLFHIRHRELTRALPTISFRFHPYPISRPFVCTFDKLVWFNIWNRHVFFAFVYFHQHPHMCDD